MACENPYSGKLSSTYLHYDAYGDERINPANGTKVSVTGKADAVTKFLIDTFTSDEQIAFLMRVHENLKHFHETNLEACQKKTEELKMIVETFKGIVDSI